MHRSNPRRRSPPPLRSSRRAPGRPRPSGRRRARSVRRRAGPRGPASTWRSRPPRRHRRPARRRPRKARRPAAGRDGRGGRRGPRSRGRCPRSSRSGRWHRRRRRARRCAAVAGVLERVPELVQPPRVDLHRLPTDRRGQLGTVGDEPVEHGPREGARPGAVLTDDERIGPPDPLPDLGERARQRIAEDRVELGGGQEVAVAAGPRRLGPVVPAVRVVQGELHKTGERDRPVPPDLVADPLGERLVLSDVGTVGRRLAAELDAWIHRLRMLAGSRVRGVRAPSGPSSEGEAEPGTHERVTAKQHRDRCGDGRGRELAQPGVDDAFVQQQV